MTRSVARLLAESLEAHDVDQIFCVPGESYVGLINALTDMNSLRLIVCRHEGGAGYMAVADGRLRNRAGCCIVSRGPGLSNAMVSLHSAYHDATPMVMLVGQVERKDFGRMALQEQNYSRLLSDVTKSVIEVIEPEQASEAIARAFHLAESGTPGPVAVILPEDIFDATTDVEVDQPRPRVLSGPRSEDLDRLADMLAKSERPLILVGGALLGDALYDEAVFGDLRRLAEEWVLPISPTHRRPQLFDATHPHYGGYMGIRVPPRADHRDEARRPDGGDRRAADRQREPVLHASPPRRSRNCRWCMSGRTRTKLAACGGPSLASPASPHEVVKALLKRGAPAGAEKRRGWVNGLHAIHRKLLAKEWDPTPDGINFAAIVCEVDKHLAPDATVTSDAGNFGSFIHRYIGFKPGQIFLSSVVGAMGSGMPMAVAATLRRPGKQVVAFMGDGGALMAGNEIATACQYGGAPIIVISDNRMYGTIGMHHHVRYPGRPFQESMKLTNPDFAAWGRSFGAEGITIRDEVGGGRRDRARVRGEDQAGGGALPHVGDPDECVAKVRAEITWSACYFPRCRSKNPATSILYSFVSGAFMSR